MADWEGVTDVNALKTMLAAQQAQLQALRGKENSNPKDNRKRKSTVNNVESYELGDISDEEQAQVSLPFVQSKCARQACPLGTLPETFKEVRSNLLAHRACTRV